MKNNPSIKLNDTNLTPLTQNESGKQPEENAHWNQCLGVRRALRPASSTGEARGLPAGRALRTRAGGCEPKKSWAQTLISKLTGAENTANVTLATHWREELWVKEAKKNSICYLAYMIFVCERHPNIQNCSEWFCEAFCLIYSLLMTNILLKSQVCIIYPLTSYPFNPFPKTWSPAVRFNYV